MNKEKPSVDREQESPILSRNDLLKVASLIGSGMSLLAACEAAGVNPVVAAPALAATPERPTETATFQEPTPTKETIPQNILEQMPLLEIHGYSLQEAQVGWELLSPRKKVVLSIPDNLTISGRMENDELFLVPATFFQVENSVTLGLPIILTIKDTTKVSRFYMTETGTWVTPIEVQTDPREIENYTPIELEDVWSGRLLHSESLMVEPFPDGTAVPDRFVYYLKRSAIGRHVQLTAWFDESQYNQTDPNFQENINIDNDYRRWIAFYTSNTPSGEEVIVATEQMLNSDGKSSILIHWIFGAEWYWDAEENAKENLVETLFLGKDPTYESQAIRKIISPSIYYETIPELYNSIFSKKPSDRDATAAIELREVEHNSLFLAFPEYDTLFQKSIEEMRYGGLVGTVDQEILEWIQRTLQIGITRPIENEIRDYFDPSQ